MSPTKPLHGIKVLDLGIITAGAATSAMLADLGADVIKLETKSRPDPFRAWAGARDEDSPFFRLNNRNKRGVDVDLKSESGRKVFLALAAEADVVVENFSRGVLERLGLGFENPEKGQPLHSPGLDHGARPDRTGVRLCLLRLHPGGGGRNQLLDRVLRGKAGDKRSKPQLSGSDRQPFRLRSHNRGPQ